MIVHNGLNLTRFVLKIQICRKQHCGKMSEKRNLAAELNNASEPVTDYTCTVYEENDVHSEALYYCNSCMKTLCTTCEQLHRQMFRKHRVLDSESISDWTLSSIQISPVERCSIHSDKPVELFCENHDELCCYLCVSTTHRYVS